MQQTFRSAGLSFILERFQRRVQQFVDDTGNCCFDRLTLRVIQGWKFTIESVQFGSANVMPVLTQSVNHRARGPVVNFLHERLSLANDDAHRFLHFRLTGLAIAAAGIFQSVDIVEKHVVIDRGDLRSEVTRGGKIQNEHRMPLRLCPSRRESCIADQSLAGSRRTDDHVRLRKPVVQRRKIYGLALEQSRQPFRAL